MKTYTTFTYNGVTSEEMGLINVLVKGTDATHIIGGQKNITTTRAMSDSVNVINKVDLEPLTFSLTFTLKDKSSFTADKISEIYSYFETNDYVKLSFDDDPNFYYNVMPFTSLSELHTFINYEGYFEIEFICDSGHGWIDAEYEISYAETIPTIENLSNVMVNGEYKIYPYIKVQLSEESGGYDNTYFSIAPANDLDSNGDWCGTWFTLSNLEEGDTIYIDCKNGIITAEKTEDIYTHLSNYNFFYLPVQGENTIWKQYVAGNGYPRWTATLYFSFPVIR